VGRAPAGGFPEYPDRILDLDRYQSQRRVRALEDDEQDPGTYGDNYLQKRNPVVDEGLLQLTMGAPQPIYNCGLLMARIRHFDPERSRPGLPRDVAALVSDLKADRTGFRLVNLAAGSRDVVVQADAYAEHQFATVETDEESAAVDVPHIRVSLPPKTSVYLDAGIDRYVNDPTYEMPIS